MSFYTISEKYTKYSIELAPDFQTDEEDMDLMVRGRSFYAVWDEEAGMWSTNEYCVRKIVDKALMKRKSELLKINPSANVVIKSMKSYSSRSWTEWRGYISNMPDRFVPLDDKLAFADTEVKKTDYISKRLKYVLKEGDHASYDEIMSTLYSQENREKIEWAIGSILSGDSRKIQKFMVLYGKGGTGKGTVLKIIHMLFKGYDTVFVAKNLGLSSKDFSMEPFKTNPMVAIDEDGDLSHIEDSTKINSIVSHERILMNEKNRPQYPYTPHCFLFIGSNEPVKIKDAESGIIRRLLDVEPTGKKIPSKKYSLLLERVEFELGAIAYHCLTVYKNLGKHYYDDYRPKKMMYRTDAFLNFIEDKYDDLVNCEGVSLSTAYIWWEDYRNRAGIDKKLERHKFREELKNYFYHFDDFARVDGKLVRSWYSGFIRNCLSQKDESVKVDIQEDDVLTFNCRKSKLDEILKDCKAQYATVGENEKPKTSWIHVTTKLKDIDTTKTHYIIGPDWLVMADFDLKNEKGEKDQKLNLEAASKWPPTYGEFSKGGAGVHLYYRYTGDLDALKTQYAPDIEVKIFRGNSAIRRRLSFCNDLDISTISSGLPIKETKMVSSKVIEDERHLTNLIRKAMLSPERARKGEMAKVIRGCEHTKPACNFIKDVLDQAYESGISYDVSPLMPAMMAFGMKSTHNKRYCTDLVGKMKFKSKEASQPVEAKNRGRFAFFDCEVAPNVNLICWKEAGDDKPVRKIVMPTPKDIEEMLEYDLIGFNNRRYDNHILHAIRLGYKPEMVYGISKLIISGSDKGYFREAWDYSKTDIYDFSSEKKSLKKFEIEMDIHHQEMGVDWTQPIPEERWPELANYCANDVIATEKLFYSKDRQADWKAREILADIADMDTNATTNSLTTKIIFQGEKNPQKQFNYRDMGDVNTIDPNFEIPQIDEMGLDPEYTKFTKDGKPVFPGYSYGPSKLEDGRNGPYISTYRGEEVGEGGYVYAEPGIYTDVALDDVESMHPSSLEDEELLGPFTKNFSDIKRIRVLIKHKQYEEAKELFGGKLAKYLDDPDQAKALSSALKIAINSVYGLTSAKFTNPFKDPRNVDNIVAKRGALFMINLKHEVQRRGFTVAHIKTDSIKIPHATKDILHFINEYGKLYGYKFDHEMTYDRMCLINNAVYIAKGATVEKAEKLHGYIPSKQHEHSGTWTATGKQFQVPYVFKSLFTHEEIGIRDMMETMSVTTALYLDFNENLSPGDHNYVFVGKCGAFCPILPGKNGGELLRQNKDKYDSASGAKGYRWKEYEVVRDLDLIDDIDRGYYDKLNEKAVEEINKLGRYDLFVSEAEYPVSRDQVPPWETVEEALNNVHYI